MTTCRTACGRRAARSRLAWHPPTWTMGCILFARTLIKMRLDDLRHCEYYVLFHEHHPRFQGLTSRPFFSPSLSLSSPALSRIYHPLFSVSIHTTKQPDNI